MSRRTTNQKAHRVLTFLLGLRYGTVAAALRPSGFSKVHQAEGWRLLSLLGDLECGQGGAPNDRRQLPERLRAWSVRWMPVLRATLVRHHPEIAELLLEGLGARSDRERTLELSLLLERFDGLADMPEGRAAMATLAERGLSASVLDTLREDIASSRRLPSGTPVDRSAVDDAEEQLWAWYLEWATIARTVVTQKKDRVRLGFA